MPKLTDTDLVILSAAARRGDGETLPLPKALGIKGEAATRTPRYERKIQPMPKLGPWVEELERRLEANEKKPRRDRLSLLRIHEDLAALGYGGGYDAVRRYARTWRRRWRLLSPSQGFVPLSVRPGTL